MTGAIIIQANGSLLKSIIKFTALIHCKQLNVAILRNILYFILSVYQYFLAKIGNSFNF